jgi:hypothetical protein
MWGSRAYQIGDPWHWAQAHVEATLHLGYIKVTTRPDDAQIAWYRQRCQILIIDEHLSAARELVICALVQDMGDKETKIEKVDLVWVARIDDNKIEWM